LSWWIIYNRWNALLEHFYSGDTDAVKYYRLAADQGHSYAQNNLGNCYTYGKGVPKDISEAKYYQLEAEQGYSDAQYSLGNCYKYGKGVPKDISEAVKYYRLASKQGHSSDSIYGYLL